MTNVIRYEAMAEKAVSVRLDADAQRALELLVRDGGSQSEAIRSALITASRAARYDRMAADAERLANDPENLALIAEIQEFFGEL
jgi:Arc/MetJ-type ribon-helix-helix transcriptional regulator